MRGNNVEMLNDTLKICRDGFYVKDRKKVNLQLSEEEMEEAIVFLPEDIKKMAEDKNSPRVLRLGGRVGVGCENMDSYSLARKRMVDCKYMLSEEDRILVLNLANAIHPGGGVRKGATAQEEDLCRKSSLLMSLESKNAVSYYEYNKSLNTYMGSDAIILNPNVEIIKDEKGNLLDEPVVVSVLTCAAPNICNGLEGMTEAEYQKMLYARITGMLTVAAYNGYEVLVLGAFGCGAFRNDARVVSDIFFKAMKEFKRGNMDLDNYFRRIDFAVLDRSSDQYNFNEFSRNFNNFYQEEDNEEIVDVLKVMHMHRFEKEGVDEAKKSSTEIKLVKGDITKLTDVDAIVNAANTRLLGGGGVDGAIHRAAGPELLAECRGLNGCKTGEAKITKAYNIKVKNIIHTVGPVWKGGNNEEDKLLANAYKNSLQLAVDNGLRSVAFPSISTGVYSFPLEQAAEIAVWIAQKFIEDNPGKLDFIEWVLFDENTYEVYDKALSHMKASKTVESPTFYSINQMLNDGLV